jgi:hypothetical protein
MDDDLHLRELARPPARIARYVGEALAPIGAFAPVGPSMPADGRAHPRLRWAAGRR